MSTKLNRKCVKPPSTATLNKDIGQPHRNSDVTSHSLKSPSKIQSTQELESSLLNANECKIIIK